MDRLVTCFFEMQKFLPEAFFHRYKRLFQQEHLETLAMRLETFWKGDIPEEYPPPRLEVESTPPLKEAFEPWKKFMKFFYETNDYSDEILKHIANMFVDIPCKNTLILLGQRHTPASLTDHTAIPRTKEELLAATDTIHSSKITVGARALTKHVNRNTGEYWGEVRGSEEKKNETARNIIEKILSNTTWWNVFGHYKHDIVYEARVIEGYGARWGKDGEIFIGFLEPFTPGFPHVRDEF